MLLSVMPNKLIVVAASIGAVLSFAAHRESAARLEPTHTTWDSVYTTTQAARGDSIYHQGCVKCHGPALAGTPDGSPLAGHDFLTNWDGLTLGDLYDKILTTMPPDKPKSVAPQDIADVMAFVLAQNQFPAGQMALSPDSARMHDIKIAQNHP